MEFIYKDRQVTQNNTLDKFDKTIPDKPNNSNSSSSTSNCGRNKKLIVIFIILGIVVVGTGIFLIVHFTKKNSEEVSSGQLDYTENSGDGNEESTPPSNPTQEVEEEQKPIQLEELPLEKEFEILTKVGLRKFKVVQNTIEDNKINGNLITTKIKRITNYDLYILKEEKANNITKKYFNSTFLGAIAISSECFNSDGEDCTPIRLIDLFQEKNNTNNDTRILTNVEDLKDIPIALCLFNITDNNFILSMSCPESFPDTKRNEINLDLYFFRPPAIKRADKENDGINVTIKDDIENKKRFIRETNDGTCNVQNNIGTKCITDMNTTTDLEGTLLSYDELAITNITIDTNNFLVKVKTSNLIDTTDNYENLDQNKYKENLEKLIGMLEPYMKNEDLFTLENFEDLYSIVQAKKKSENVYVKNERKNFRNLMAHAGEYIKQENLFYYNDTGDIEIFLNLKIDSGINKFAFNCYSDLIFDEKSYYLSAFSNYTDLQATLDKLAELSKAGNHLATTLYEQIFEKLNNITNNITVKINSLKELIQYHELSNIFDATLSLDSINKLPLHIIEDSKILENKLNKVYDDIVTGNTKYNVDKLSNSIYEYNKKLFNLVQAIFQNLRDLSNILKSDKNQLTEIATYYLNYSTYSYENIIQEIDKILNNYYIDGYNKINTKLEAMFNEFEKDYIDTLNSSKKLINHLINKLENKSYSIEYASDEDFKNLITKLYQSYKYTEDIFNKIKNYINNEINIKDSGYFISNAEITNNNESFSPIIKEAKEVANKLDNDEYIDKIFDNIMINFEDNITNIIINMENQKESQFPLQENALKYGLFNDNSKEKIIKDIKGIRTKINTDINNENDFYINGIRQAINNFKDNEKILNDIISDLQVIFSSQKLQELADMFDVAFNSILDKTHNDIIINENLAKKYFDEFEKIINDNNYIKNLINTRYAIDSRIYSSGWRRFIRIDYLNILAKRRTSGYLLKYNTYKASLDYTKKYLNDYFCSDILNTYKTILSKIKEDLQSIRNLKITEKYPDFPEFDFYNENIRIIDKLIKQFDNFFEDNIFNSKYLEPMYKLKNEKLNYLTPIENYINNKHEKISKLSTFNDVLNDFCIEFNRKVCYGCTNCAWYTYIRDQFCLPLSTSKYYLQLIKVDINSNTNLKNFLLEFNKFYNELHNKIENYNSIWNDLENNFITKKIETIESKMTLNYLEPMNSWLNNILEEKYEDNLIKASYDFYQNLIKERLKVIYDESIINYNTTFEHLLEKIEQNYDSFTNSISEYRIMASIYNAIFQQNSTKDYFNIIISFQKTEFNYTISYYYLYLKKIIDESYQYIISKIPTNEKGFNEILNTRTNEIHDLFNKIYNNLTNSQNYALNLYNQKTLLNVPETNFFKVNNIMTDYLYNLKECIDEKIISLSQFKSLYRDETSLVSRFYLEIQQNWKRTEAFYEQVNHQLFVVLNLEQFNEIVFDNWIFEQDGFINKLNNTLIESIKEIRNDFLFEKENYIRVLENEIDKQLNESIEIKIINFYSSGFNSLTSNQVTNIENNFNAIINLIKEKIISQSNELEKNASSYNSDYSKIKKTLDDYKTKLINELDSAIIAVLYNVYENIENNFYKNCFSTSLEEYLKQSQKETSKTDFGEFELYNTSYKIGEIIQNLLTDIINNYNKTTKDIIYQKYLGNLEKIKTSINYESLINSMNNEIDETFNSTLLKSLEKKATNDPNNTLYSQYDFNDNINNEINTLIEQNIKNIKLEIEQTKGTNYEIKTTCELDFSLSGLGVVKDVCKEFKTFLGTEKDDQKNKINNVIKSNIYSNFDELLKNVIPSFGTLFFDRIIKFNQNFKINSLYNNLKFSLAQTLLYYNYLYKTTTDVLPKELKIRIYNLNNLDSTVEEKNKQILSLLEKKIGEFIRESRNKILKKYKDYLSEDVSINQAFDKTVLKKIEDNLIEIEPLLEKNYENMVESFFKEKLLKAYSDFMNQKTNEMKRTVYEERELLKSQIDDLFSLDSEKVLIEINQIINKTLNSIKEYNNFIDTYEISDDIKEYFNEFAISKVLPIFSDFQIELNKATKDKIVLNINKNSENIESLNPDQIILKSNEYKEYFNKNFFSSINSSIESYGINDFKKKLDLEREKENETLRRRLSGTETEEDIEKNAKAKINDRGIEESFNKILNLSEDTKSFFNGLKAFNEFEKNITTSMKKINSSSKKSIEQITNNSYADDVEIFLKEKLENLTIISQEYYSSINESYFNLKNYLNKSLTDINTLLKQCASITYNTMNSEYENISKYTTNVSQNYSLKNKNITDKQYDKKTEHYLKTVTAKIFDFNEYAEFKFDLSFEEGALKKPKVNARIVDKSYTKKMKFIISNPFGNCGENIKELNVYFNEANYTMNLDYIYENNSIDISTFTNFEEYIYETEIYKIEEMNETDCISSSGINLCLIGECINRDKKIKQNKNTTRIEAYINKSSTNIGC